jgi:gliding motility-associated-like protein
MGLLRTLSIFIFAAFCISTSAQVPGQRQMSLLESKNANFFSPIHDSSWNNARSRISTLATQRVAFSPLDTCATHTYRLQIGTNNSNDEVSDITALLSGDVLVAGKTNKNNQQDDALLIRVNASGTILWSRTYGENNRQEVFYKARETSDGGIITIGSAFGPAIGEGHILMCKMDGNGNLQWTKKYRSPANTFARGSDIIELLEGNFVFLGDNRVKLLYGKLTPSGNLLWHQEVKVSDSTRALNLIENEFQGIFVASSGMDTGWHVSNMIHVLQSDGNVIARQRLGGSVMQAHYIFQKMQLINLRPRITGVYAAIGQPYQFMRLNGNGSSGFARMERYTIPGVNPDTTSTMVLTSWAEAIAFSPGNNTNTISIFQHIPDVQQVPWGYAYTAPATLQLISIEKTMDAGYIAACNMANNSANDILLIKVDSAGLSPGCDGSAISVGNTIINPSIPGSSATGTINTPVADNNPVLSAVVQLDSIYYCRQLTCPVRPIEDTCLATFTKHYRSYEFCDVVTCASITPDDHLILLGLHRDNPYNASWERSFLIKTDNKGNLVAKKRLSIGQNCRILSQIRLSDNNILAAGYVLGSQNASGFFLVKLDNDLNIIWTKNYSITQTSWHFSSMAEAADGSLFISLYYHDFSNLNDRMILTKFDNTGNYIWQKIYRPTGSVSLFAYVGSLIPSGQDIYFQSQIFYDVEQRWKTLVTKIDQASGNILWSKRYSYAGRHTEFNRGVKMSGNSFYYSGFIELPSQAGQAFMKIDRDGNILKRAMHTTPVGDISYTSNLAANSDILLSGRFTDYSVNPAVSYRPFVRLDSNFNIRLSKKSPMINYSYSSGILEDHQGFVYVYGTNNFSSGYNADLSLKKYTPDGSSGTCPSDTFIVEQPALVLTVADQTMLTSTGTPFPLVAIPALEIDFSLQQNGMYCGSVSGCDTLWLSGPATVCDSSSAFTFYANKNPGCNATVNWTVSPSSAEIQQQTDSLIKLRFLQNTTFTLKAQLLTGCRVLTDSLSIIAHPSPSLRLGPDTTLCPNNSLLLNARSGFQTYLWQDNSTDSFFLVTSPGTYFVKTTDACGNISNDTVIVSAAPPVPFDIGPDLAKCNNDSIILSSPPGFINYTWSPTYNINQSTGQSVIVYPTIDTSYMVKAEKTPGCFAYDTVHIAVHHSPPINLGADTSFCIGNNVTLNAGTGFQNYTWNTGAITQQLQVQSAGIYSILATTTQGCRSYDTLRVVNVYNKPTVNLVNDSLICANTTSILDAGPGFKTYAWSNGTAGQTISVNTPGRYWVLVTDLHDCSNSDTTVITRILATPSDFLPADTSLCSYSSMQIKPASSFKSYLWNTGSTGNAITVTQPGWYWLQVKDYSNCEGKDSILINPKQCMEGFYIPSAFTPNNDGQNDTFSPLLFGIVIKYKFLVYNRWGEKVFETSSLQNGWNGKVSGSPTDSNVFVWQCSYQFQGQREEHRKGTFILIR